MFKIIVFSAAVVASLFLLLVFLKGYDCLEVYNVSNPKYHFPTGSGMGLYAALAISLTDSPNIDVFLAVFFEAFYSLPANDSYYEYPPLVSDGRKFDRRSMYESMETKLDLKGYPGKTCLLRSICEAALYTLKHSNGLLGDLFHLILTPSTTVDPEQEYFSDYRKAEEQGSKSQNCDKYNGCLVSMLDLMGFVK